MRMDPRRRRRRRRDDVGPFPGERATRIARRQDHCARRLQGNPPRGAVRSQGPKDCRSARERDPDLARRFAGERGRDAARPSGDRLRGFVHLRRRQSGTARQIQRPTMDKQPIRRRQSSGARRRSNVAARRGHARAMDGPLVPSLGLLLAGEDLARCGVARPAAIRHHLALRVFGGDHPRRLALRIRWRGVGSGDRSRRNREPRRDRTGLSGALPGERLQIALLSKRRHIVILRRHGAADRCERSGSWLLRPGAAGDPATRGALWDDECLQAVGRRAAAGHRDQ